MERELALPLDRAQRVLIVYPLGAGEGLLLDRLNPRWRERYFEPDVRARRGVHVSLTSRRSLLRHAPDSAYVIAATPQRDFRSLLPLIS